MKAIITQQPPLLLSPLSFLIRQPYQPALGETRTCVCVCIHTFACVCAAKWDIPNAIHWIQEAHHLKNSVKR